MNAAQACHFWCRATTYPHTLHLDAGHVCPVQMRVVACARCYASTRCLAVFETSARRTHGPISREKYDGKIGDENVGRSCRCRVSLRVCRFACAGRRKRQRWQWQRQRSRCRNRGNDVSQRAGIEPVEQGARRHQQNGRQRAHGYAEYAVQRRQHVGEDSRVTARLSRLLLVP